MDPASIGALLSGGSSLVSGLSGLFGGDGGASDAANAALRQASAQYEDTKNTNRAVAGQQLALADPLYQQSMAANRQYLAALGLPYITSDLVGTNIQHQGDNFVGRRADGSTFFVNQLPQAPGGAQQGGQQSAASNPFGVPQSNGGQQSGGAASGSAWNPNAAMGSPIGTADGVQYFRRDQNSLMPYDWAQGTGFQQTPGYQFQVDEGVRALDHSAAARGMTASGAQMKALTRFGQGTANQEYNNWLNRVGAVAGQAPQAAGAQSGIYGNLGANQAQNSGNLASLAMTNGSTQVDLANRSQSSFNGNLSNVFKGLGSIGSYFGA